MARFCGCVGVANESPVSQHSARSHRRILLTFTKSGSRKDKHGVDLISHALPFGRLWYAGPNASDFVIKKITAPHTDDVKGGCSPQNTIVLNQRPAHCNQATRLIYV